MTEERVLAAVLIVIWGLAAIGSVAVVALVVYRAWPWSLAAIPIVWGAWRLADDEMFKRWIG